jgi:hypothetical protein
VIFHLIWMGLGASFALALFVGQLFRRTKGDDR